MTQTYLPFLKIVSLLKNISHEKETGTFFIVTDNNRSARLTLKKGEIIRIYYFNKFGVDALQLLLSISSGTCRFLKGNVPTRRDDIPSTSTILDILTSPTKDMPTNTNGDLIVRLEQKEVLEDCLEEYIGPMASVIFEEHSNMDMDFNTILLNLKAVVESISGTEDANNYQKSVEEKLR